GFEPATSGLTGRRALQTAPQDLEVRPETLPEGRRGPFWVSGGRGDQLLQVRQRQRPGEQEALAELAPERAQRVELLGGLDALGCRLQVEGLGDVDDGAPEARVLGAPGDALHEGLVDLQEVDRQPPQVAERGVTGAEVVERHAHAKSLEVLEAGDD